jgi:hypothetical protein
MLIGAASAGILVAGYAALAPSEPDPAASAPAVVVQTQAVEGTASPAPQRPTEAAAAREEKPETEPSTKQAAPSAEARNERPPATPQRSADEAPAAASPSAEPAAPSELNASPAAPLTPDERASQLREESRLLSEARDALRRGDAAGSFRRLEEARTRFGGGLLGQEREALTIEALYRSGQRSAASARAEAFLRAYPLSPLSTRVQAFAQ